MNTDARGFRRALSRFHRWSVLLLLPVFCAGCDSAEFPGTAVPISGVSDIPYVVTYAFGFETGTEDMIGGVRRGIDASNLVVISSGDLLNLTAAANITQQPGMGIVGGLLRFDSGESAENIVLIATDSTGNRIGDVFYNSLGGTPDFVQILGTNETGGFTIFNVPPGEVFIQATQGGRGNTRLVAFPNQVSLISFIVTQVSPENTGVVAQVTEVGSEQFTGSIELTAVGVVADEDRDGVLNDQDFCPGTPSVEAVDMDGCAEEDDRTGVIADGLLGISNEQGSASFSLSSQSDYLVRMSNLPEDFVDTYQVLDTSRAPTILNLPTGEPMVLDQTETIWVIRREILNALAEQALVTMLPGHGVITGMITRGDGTPRSHARVHITDQAGQAIDGVEVVYYNSLAQPDRSLSHSTVDGGYIIFNVPPGLVFLNLTAVLTEGGPLTLFSKNAHLNIFSDSVFQRSFVLRLIPKPDSTNTQNQASLTVNIHGSVTEEDGITPVTATAHVSAMGIGPDLAICLATGFPGTCPDGSFTILQAPQTVDTPAEVPSLLAFSDYIVRVAAEGYRSTYHTIETGSPLASEETSHLTLIHSSVMQAWEGQAGIQQTVTTGEQWMHGVITGSANDLESGRPVEGVTLRVRDDNSEEYAVYYFSQQTGQIDPGLSATDPSGRYLVFNFPQGPAFISVTSPDDSGDIFTQVFSDGVTVADINFNNAPPPRVGLSGDTRNLQGESVGGVLLTVQGGDLRTNEEGEEEVFEVQSQANGSFGGVISTFNQVTMKASGEELMDTYNYGVVISDHSPSRQDLHVATRSEVESMALTSGISLDPGRGIVMGETLMSSLGVPEYTEMQGAPQAVWSASFNRDLFEDLAVLNQDTGQVAVYLNQGGSLVLSALYDTDSEPVDLVSADLNGDLNEDLVVANYDSNSITVLMGSRQGVFSSGQSFPVSGHGPIGVDVGDFDADQNMDIFVASRLSDTVHVLLGDGHGGFVEDPDKMVELSDSQYPFHLGHGGLPQCRPVTFHLALLDGDTLPDWIIGCDGPVPNRILFFQSTIGYTTSPLLDGYTLADLDFADLDGDRRPDFVALLTALSPEGPGAIQLALSRGGGFGLFSGIRPAALHLQDINRDGAADIIVAHEGAPDPGEDCANGMDDNGDELVDGRDPQCPSLWVLPSTGSGGIGLQPLAMSLAPGASGPAGITAADLDQDDFMEMVVVNRETRNMAVIPVQEVPQPGIALEAIGLDGISSGVVKYLDPVSGTVDISLQATAISQTSGGIQGGRFVIFDVPPGPIRVRSVSGATGSRLVSVYPDSISWLPHKFPEAEVSGVLVTGVTVDAVARPVGEVEVAFLNSASVSFSEPVGLDSFGNIMGASYGAFLDANSEYIIRLTRVGVGGLPGVEGDLDFDSIDDRLDDCPGVFNPDQTDTDGDNIGDACDPTPLGG